MKIEEMVLVDTVDSYNYHTMYSNCVKVHKHFCTTFSKTCNFLNVTLACNFCFFSSLTYNFQDDFIVDHCKTVYRYNFNI